MKPNGMRAWRKAARRWRRKQNRRSGAPCVDGPGRWYRRQRAWFKVRPTIPHSSFAPCSLVGMTMGARKRKAKFDAWHKAVTYGREVITRALRRCIATDRTILRVGNVASEYAQQRRRYRIGERLRPCAGCPRCLTKYEATFVPGRTDRWRLHDKECRESKGTKGYCEDGRWMNGTPCDGSGVIPARSRVNQGKPLAVEPARLNP